MSGEPMRTPPIGTFIQCSSRLRWVARTFEAVNRPRQDCGKGTTIMISSPRTSLASALAAAAIAALAIATGPSAVSAGAISAQVISTAKAISAPAVGAGTAAIVKVGRRYRSRSLRRRLIFSTRYAHVRRYSRPRVYIYIGRPRRIYRPRVYYRTTRYCAMRRDSCAFRFGYRTRSWYRCVRHYGCSARRYH